MIGVMQWRKEYPLGLAILIAPFSLDRTSFVEAGSRRSGFLDRPAWWLWRARSVFAYGCQSTVAQPRAGTSNRSSAPPTERVV
jgi:hypothetical protein